MGLPRSLTWSCERSYKRLSGRTMPTATTTPRTNSEKEAAWLEDIHLQNQEKTARSTWTVFWQAIMKGLIMCQQCVYCQVVRAWATEETRNKKMSFPQEEWKTLSSVNVNDKVEKERTKLSLVGLGVANTNGTLPRKRFWYTQKDSSQTARQR